MTGMMRAALLVLAALSATGARAAPAETASASQEDRRVLVMLRLAPEHYRPGGDYGGGGYGDATAAEARRRMALRIAHDAGVTLSDNWPMPILGIDCVVMIVPPEQSIDTAVERLSHTAGVAWSQRINRFETQAERPSLPNDRLYRAQPAARAWQLAALHRMATGRGVTVAVIDSGVDASHPDLRGQLSVNRDFVNDKGVNPESHGTGVAGIIAARANNAIGIAGVAPEAQLLGLRACWQRAGAGGTVCDTLSLAKALTFAIERKARVINLSLTGPRDRLLADLIGIGLKRGAAIVAAVDPKTGTGFPASVPGVIPVAENDLATSRYGAYIAPGRDVPTTEPGGRWYLVSGNSYAAAHVSGLLALMQQLQPGRAGRALVAQRGLIDACDTVRRLAPGGGVACPAD